MEKGLEEANYKLIDIDLPKCCHQCEFSQIEYEDIFCTIHWYVVDQFGICDDFSY